IADVAINAVLGGGGILRVIIERTGPDGTVTRYLSPVQPKSFDGDAHARFGVASFNPALVKHVVAGMPAAEAGIRPGDVIVRAQGKPVETVTFTALVEGMTDDESLALEVQRGPDTVLMNLRPARIGRFKGISLWPPPNWGTLLDGEAPLRVCYDSAPFLSELGLRLHDQIVRIGESPASAAGLLKQAETDPAAQIAVGIQRAGVEETRQLTVMQLAQAVTELDLDAPPAILQLTEEAAEATGLQRKDIILEVDGQPATATVLRELERTRLDEELPVTVKRPAIGLGLLQREETLSAHLPVATVGAVGVFWGTQTVFHRVPLKLVVPEAVHQGYQALARTLKTLALLVTGGLSPKDLGGPVMIYQVTTEAARMGYSWLLEMTAFISINLCVFNLLPLPVLDGGHLVLLGVEGVRRKPLDVRVVERVQQFGLLFIVALILFITVNDIKRIVTFMIP
ncbi:MAG: site-2 protease family protein, partial [Candidatus Hydrogenedentes bacterium]|nr:site-2 protease family protein [Candidatus Hydrogenedentota bacterium]